MKIITFLLPFLAAIATAQTVCIDPGHPSEVGQGTTGKKISEIRAAWQVAQLLKKDLEAKGVKVVMTKSKENQVVKNRDRAATANKAHADLMVRLHCDSVEGSGFAVYIPRGKGTAQGKTGPSDRVLADCAKMGPAFHDALVKGLKGKLKDNGLLTDKQTAVGAKFGALIGSIFSDVPVVLIEMCRLSNSKDEAFISSKSGQEAMASALTDATMNALNALGSKG